MSEKGGQLKEWLKLKLHKYCRESYLEFIWADAWFLIAVCSLLFSFFGVDIYDPMKSFRHLFVVMIIIVSFWLIKIFMSTTSRMWMTAYLFKEYKKEGIYRLFIVANFSLVFYTLMVLTGFPVLYGIVLMPVLRLVLMGEDEVIQNRILRAAIAETQSYVDITAFSPMMKESTYDSLMDLTRIKDSMYRAAREQVKSQKMKTELITNLSHDLKTPLTSIINYADILSKKETMDDEAKSYVHILGRNSERLKSMIVNLIDASKTGSGNVTLEPAVIDFNELIGQIYGDVAADYEARDLNFTYESDEENIPMYTDGNALSRVIQNLFSNAYKYAKPETTVEGRASIVSDKVFFSLKNTSKNRINVSNSELQDQFIRGDKSRTTEGSGLGLYIAKNLVEILGGKFRIVVDDDQFQVFIELPKEIESK
ncbi:MAG: HAMP domain-containing sensor histidine kinase [Peptoniphilus sp.]|nr:HAMP domain-containing sensor histidine kinase [Peptoniphilus sp.]MDD7363016.1 HAMP domain-containing sensor histidine kinase [Bacillota bacterium]MDY6045281.1 HAMP domain-containing sensor histidine kinase [Peptoniphilus sp.]